MPGKFRWAALAAACLLGAGAAQAFSLREAFDAALRYDGQYRVAGHELDAARQNLPIARSSLMPLVTLSASTASVTGTREFPNSLNQSVRIPADYNSPQASLQLRTPIFNYDALSRYRQAGFQVLSAEALYEFRGYELAERVATTYMQVLLANDNVMLAEAEITALDAQVARSQQRQLRGEGTRTEVAQTQAALDVARVRQIEAADQLENARRALRRYTGQDIVKARNILPGFMPPPLTPTKLEEWLELGERQNPQLRVRQQNLIVANFGVDRSKAGHLPRLDFVAGVNRSRNESLSSLNQTSTLKSIGVQLSVPLYSGGGVDAAVSQALADRSRAEEEIRVERETMQLEVLRQFYAVSNGTAKIEAYLRAVSSSETALEGATRALAAGLGTNSEVLDAQTRRFTALRDLAQTRYEYLVSRLRLMMQAGIPVADVVADFDRSLPIESTLKIRTTP